MSEPQELCPYCEIEINLRTDIDIDNADEIIHPENDCILSETIWVGVGVVWGWNNRPIEDALKTENARLEALLRPYLDAEERLGMDLKNMLIKLHAAQMKDN